MEWTHWVPLCKGANAAPCTLQLIGADKFKHRPCCTLDCASARLSRQSRPCKPLITTCRRPLMNSARSILALANMSSEEAPCCIGRGGCYDEYLGASSTGGCVTWRLWVALFGVRPPSGLGSGPHSAMQPLVNLQCHRLAAAQPVRVRVRAQAMASTCSSLCFLHYYCMHDSHASRNSYGSPCSCAVHQISWMSHYMGDRNGVISCVTICFHKQIYFT